MNDNDFLKCPLCIQFKLSIRSLNITLIAEFIGCCVLAQITLESFELVVLALYMHFELVFLSVGLTADLTYKRPLSQMNLIHMFLKIPRKRDKKDWFD